MASIKGRLSRLRELGLIRASSLEHDAVPVDGAAGSEPADGGGEASTSRPAGTRDATGESSASRDERPGTRTARFLSGWDEVSPHVWMRTVETPLSAPQSVDPGAWAGRSRAATGAGYPSGTESRAWPGDPAEYSFFDFETTGLSGGAGTLPFLAAVGAFVQAGSPGFLATQVFLDDYPGEPDFLALVLDLLGSREAAVTYNGAAFDVPLLRTRCIMNGVAMCDFMHADAIHAARRLWKRRLESCSLKHIERAVLDLDRGDDVQGRDIPAMWLDYVAGRGEGAMDLVCSHNASDITSLARLFLRIDAVHRDPLAPGVLSSVDGARLGRWLHRTGRADEALALLEEDAADGSAESGIMRYAILRSAGRLAEAADAAFRLPDTLRSCVVKAKAAEHILRDHAAALAWTNEALSRLGTITPDERIPESCGREALEKRLARIERKARAASDDAKGEVGTRGKASGVP